MSQVLNIKSLTEWFKDPKNKTISRFVLLFFSGILMLSLGKFLTMGKNEKLTKNSAESINALPENNKIVYDQSYEERLENQLCGLLQQINGVGDVKVMLTLEEEIVVEPAFNVIDTEKKSEEKDNKGGVRTVIEKQTNKQVVLLKRSGEEELIILKKTNPRIKGILIVADGAASSIVKDKLIKATATLLDIPFYKITVMEKR